MLTEGLAINVRIVGSVRDFFLPALWVSAVEIIQFAPIFTSESPNEDRVGCHLAFLLKEVCMNQFAKHLAWVCMALFSLNAVAQDGLESLRETSRAFASVGEKVSPSVVFVRTERAIRATQAPNSSPFGDEFFERFFGQPFPGTPQQPPSQRRAVGQGSGFVFSVDDGLLEDKAYILTNNHVVEGADSILVTFADGREFEAEITGTDPQTDVAVIEIEGDNLPALTLGDSSALEVGEWVLAIGSPYGLR